MPKQKDDPIKKFQKETKKRAEKAQKDKKKESRNKNEEKTEYEMILKRLNYIEKELRKEHSLGRRIYKAIISGVFGTFGATVVFALAIFLLALIIDRTENIPIINDLIEKTHLEKLINDYNTLKEAAEDEVEQQEQEEDQQEQQQNTSGN